MSRNHKALILKSKCPRPQRVKGSTESSDISTANSSTSETPSTKIARSYIHYPPDLQSVTPEEAHAVSVDTHPDSQSQLNVEEIGTELSLTSPDFRDESRTQSKSTQGRIETTGVLEKSPQEDLAPVVSDTSLDTVQTKDSLSRRVALLLSATTAPPGDHNRMHAFKRSPSEDSGSFTSEAGSPDSIENIFSSSRRSREVKNGNQTPGLC